MRLLLVCLLVWGAGPSRVAAAQASDLVRAAATAEEPETRAEALLRARQLKQQTLEPNEPDALQRGLDYVEDRALYILSRNGWFPKVGSLTTGSGFAFGAGFRNRSLFSRRGAAEVWAAGTFSKYWAMQARAGFSQLAGGRLTTELVVDLREYPNEDFFGLGPDSRLENEQEFSLRSREFVGRAGVRLAPALMAGGGVGWFTPRVAAGEIDYLRTGAFFDVDYREPLNARRGGWYRVTVDRFDDRDGGRQSFTRTDVDLRQFIGFFADRRVIALRGLVSSTTPSDGSIGVPFYLMPTLGGKDSLRGFHDYRFRGPHALLLQAEYRWEIWSGLDGALFTDAGKVAMRRSDLNFDRLETDYGFGFRFNTSDGVIMRVDAAFGSRDGKRLHIVFGGVF